MKKNFLKLNKKLLEPKFFSFFVASILIIFTLAVYLSRKPPLKTAQNTQKNSSEQELCVNKFDSFKEEFDCYESYFEELSAKYDPSFSLTKLNELSNQIPFVKNYCHPLTHSIGRLSAKYYKDISQTFSYGKEICWSGYYHGAMEGFVSLVGRENIGRGINDICEKQKQNEKYSFDHYNCVHGLGHGLTALLDYEIFEALNYCDKLQDIWERDSCSGGVFMENIVNDGINHNSKYLKADDLEYPCNSVEKRFKNPCYLMQSSHFLKVLSYDYKKGFAECEKVEKDYRSSCFQSIGRDISGNYLRNIQKTLQLCGLAKKEFQILCFQGAAKDFTFNDRNSNKAKQLCEALPVDYKTTCLHTIYQVESTF